MKIKFFGVRGSYPVPGQDTTKYGGNTTCVTFTNEVCGKIDRIIIDCGTGAVNLGKEIIGNYFATKEDLDICMLFTHLHPDHTQAFPFFAPNYFKDSKMGLHGMETLKKNVGKILESAMLPPTFPIEYRELKSTRRHHIADDGDIIESPLGTMRVQVMKAYAPSHPQQGCLYFKVTEIIEREGDVIYDDNGCGMSSPEKLGKSVACIWDNESKSGGDKAVINFAKDCDIMIHDTQYTTDEYESDKIVVQGFGHSTYDMAYENATQAGIKDKLICTHFNPTHTDKTLDDISDAWGDHKMNIILAKEGMEIEV